MRWQKYKVSGNNFQDFFKSKKLENFVLHFFPDLAFHLPASPRSQCQQSVNYIIERDEQKIRLHTFDNVE